MLARRVLVCFILGAGSGVVMACSEMPAPVAVERVARLQETRERATELLAQPGRYPRGIEDDFLRIETEVAGFGGLYLDDNDDLVAISTGVESDIRVRDRVHEYVRFAPERFVKPDGSQPAVLVKRGELAFSQLLDFLFLLRAQLTVEDDVVFLDADERRNLLRLGLGPNGTITRAYALARRAGLDPSAPYIESMGDHPRSSQMFSLRARWRPTFAGIQTAIADGGICTMGLHIIVEGNSSFLTASHCTRNFFGATGVIFHQPTASSSNQVGFEHLNPPWSISGCMPSVHYCRLSDAASIKFDMSSLLTKAVGESSSIGTGNSTGNVTLGAVYSIGSQGDALVGTTVIKTGRTTGSTSGPVVGTCVNVGPVANGPSNFEVFCASEVAATASGGDSGGPVYRWTVPLVPSSRMAHGVLFAFGQVGGVDRYWYSSLSQVEADLGTVLWAF